MILPGGYDLEIQGQGLSENMTITVCGQRCPVINASYSTVTCATPTHITTDYVDYMSSTNNSIDLVR